MQLRLTYAPIEREPAASGVMVKPWLRLVSPAPAEAPAMRMARRKDIDAAIAEIDDLLIC